MAGGHQRRLMVNANRSGAAADRGGRAGRRAGRSGTEVLLRGQAHHRAPRHAGRRRCVDVHADARIALDDGKDQDKLKRHGAAIHSGDTVGVTLEERLFSTPASSAERREGVSWLQLWSSTSAVSGLAPSLSTEYSSVTPLYL